MIGIIQTAGCVYRFFRHMHTAGCVHSY